MTNSKNSSSQRATSRRGGRGDKPAPGTTDLDRSLKLASATALSSAGTYVRINVVLSEPRGDDSRGGKWVADITDVDVLGVTHGIDLSADVSCMSCKAGTAVSVLNEAFTLAGVMQYLHARRGYGVFARKATEPHMIALGQQLGIALMDQSEWEHWLVRVSGAYPVPRMFEESVDGELGAQLQRRTDIEVLLRYLRTEYWYYRDYRNVQTLIKQLRHAAANLNASPLSQFVVIDAATLFALAILQMCEFVSASGLSRFRDTAPPYLFGGVPTYRTRKEMLRSVEELLRAKKLLGDGQEMPALNPPFLPDLLEIILRWCSKPLAAGRVPQYLGVRAGHAAAAAAGVQAMPLVHGESDFTEKFALDLVEFLGKAAKLRPDLVSSIIRETVEVGAGPELTRGVGGKPEGHTKKARTESEQPDLLSAADGDMA